MFNSTVHWLLDPKQGNFKLPERAPTACGTISNKFFISVGLNWCSLCAFRLVLMGVNKEAILLARPHPFQCSITFTSLFLPFPERGWNLPKVCPVPSAAHALPLPNTCLFAEIFPLVLLGLVVLSFRVCEWIHAERRGQVEGSHTSLLPVPLGNKQEFPPKKGRKTGEIHSTSLPQSRDQ